MCGLLDRLLADMQVMNRRPMLTTPSVANLFSGGVVAQEEIDRLKTRVARIERRLDMVER